MYSADLKAVAEALEAAAGASTTANDSEGGWWLRIALASEALAGASTTANDNVFGFMLRTARALESIAGTSGAEENDGYGGLLKRIADALEVQAGAVTAGSLEERVLIAALAAVFSLYNAYAFAADFANGEYWSGGTQYGASDDNRGTDTFPANFANWTAQSGSVSVVASNMVVADVGGTDGLVSRTYAVPAGSLVEATIVVAAATSGTRVLYVGENSGPGKASDGTFGLAIGVNTFRWRASTATAVLSILAGATNLSVSVESVLFKVIAGPWALPGYTYTRTGEQGAVKSQTYGPDIKTGASTASASAAANGTTIYQAPVTGLVIGKSYRVSFNVSGWSAGGMNIRLGNNTLNNGNPGLVGDGSYAVVISPNNIATNDLTLVASGGSNTYTLSGIKVEELLPTVGYFAANVPAINDRGYHAYGALTNYLQYSQDLSQWTVSGTLSGNAGIAPDGTQTADEVTLNTTGHGIYKSASTGTINPGDKVTLSVWLKAQVAGTYQLYVNGVTNVSNNQVAGSGTVCNVTTEWQRFTLVFTVIGGDNGLFLILSGPSAGAVVQAWQGQVLLGNFPDGGPIIRTAGATASIGASTLTADVAPTDQEQLFFVTGTPSDFNSGGLYENVLAHLTDVSTNNSIRLRVTTAGLPSALVVAGGATVYSAAAAGAVSQGAALTIVLLRQGGNWRAGTVIGGVLSWFGAATAGAFPTGMTQAMLGHRNGTSHTQGPLAGVFIRPGTYATDADVLAAVAETA